MRSRLHVKMRHIPGLILLALLLCAAPATALPAETGGEQTLQPKSPPPEGTPTRVINIGVSRQGEADVFCIDFNKPRIPDLQTVDNGAPRIYFDIPDIHEWSGAKRYDVNGTYIQAVRTHHNTDKKTMRVVLDLNDRYNYRVDPSWVEDYYLFCIAISKR